MTDVLEVVREGLTRPHRELPPKFFYDARGSELFEEITRLPEYYLTRAEREILCVSAADIAEWSGAATLVELGAGSAAKTRILLSALTAAGDAAYVPVDVSATMLAETAAKLRQEYPRLTVHPLVADIEESFTIPADLPGPVLFAFLGSTIGNFDEPDAIALLRRVAGLMGPADRFLLGVDLRKAPETLEAAYNDSRGVTAEFNRNMLRVLNARVGADFDVDCFGHRAVYDRARHRIEMYLDSLADQTVRIPGLPPVSFRRGESIRTEISCKYDRAAIDALFAAAGLATERWLTDAAGRFALALARPVA